MNEVNQTIPRVQELCSQLLDARLDAAAFADLDRLLRDDAEARDAYLQFVLIHTGARRQRAADQTLRPKAGSASAWVSYERLPPRATPTLSPPWGEASGTPPP
ncbi:MAG: hypothetical protein GC162_03055 [Planctomycetes bacterium]|nr:hypothetical protein [Planctomycetota bacterium]